MSKEQSNTREFGRPKKYENGTKRICISLPVELVEAFKDVGASNWVREQLMKVVESRK